jgi:hypothetical protein
MANQFKATRDPRITTHESRTAGNIPWLLVAGFWLLASGCVERSLTIRSNPPGAAVYLHDQWVGETPYSFDPVWYGGYRVMLEKDGFKRLHDRREYKAPKKLWIPFDLAMELAPWRVRDDQVWEYALEPVETLPEPVPPEIPAKAEE